MAKKKSKKTKIRRRRRSVGALDMKPTSMLTKLVAVGAGFLLGNQINNFVSNLTGGKISGKITAGAELGLGALLLMSKKNPSMFKTLAGGILAGAGLKAGLKEFGIINGIGAARRVNGYGKVPVVAGYGQVPVIGAYAAPGSLNGYATPGSLNGRKVMAGVDMANNASRLSDMARKSAA